MDFQRRGYFWEMSRKQLATIGILILLFVPEFCQKSLAIEGPPVKTYDAHSYYEEDGLASNIVYDMVQATDGLLWFITQKGISTFDGLRWETFKDTEGAPPETSRLKLLPTAEGGMLAFGSFSDQIFLRYHLGGKWQQLPLPANGEASFSNMRLSKISMTEYAPNRFYVGFIHENFIYLFDSATKKWNHFVLPQEIGDWEDVSEISFFQNNLYLLSNKGLSSFHLQSEVFNTIVFPELRNKQLLTSAGSPDGKALYILGDNFVGRVCEGEYKELVSGIYPDLTQFIGYSSLLADRNNRLFFNHNAALFKFNTRTKTLDSFKIDKPKSSAIPTKIFEDKEGNIWFCSMRGVSKISSFKFHTLNQESGLVSDEISTIFPLDSSSLLLGGNTGFSILKENKIYNSPIAPSNHNASLTRILQAMKTPANQTYLAAASLGLGKLRKDKSVDWYPHPENKIINTVAYHQGKVLVGTADGYIYNFTNDRYEFFWQKENNNLYIRKIIPAGDRLILLTSLGLYHLGGDSSTHVNGTNVWNGNIYSYFTWNSRIFLGTMEGLCELVDNKIKKITETSLRIDRPVYALLEDKQGRLWAGTDKGVFVHHKGHFVNYHTAHGLAGKEVNRHAFELMANGEIWIGTDQGISVYEPEDDIEKQILPTIRITGIELPNGKFFLQEEKTELKNNENTLAFSFQTISFHLPSELNYRYKLEGIDKNWIYSDNHLLNTVRYTNLPPGKFRFVVQARSSDGVWSGASRSLPIIIHAPFYTAWWFVLLLLGFIVSMGYAMHAFIMHKRNAKQLQQAIEEKKKEINKSERRFKAIWEATDTGIALLNRSGKILMANPAMCNILQTHKEAVAGTCIYHLLATPLFSDSSISKMYDNKKVVRKNIAIRLDKKTLYLIITINFVDHLMPGESLMVVGCKDITDQKLTEANNVRLNEELLRQNMSLLKKEEELANYNHELLQQREELEQALKAVEERNFELDQFVYKTSHDLRAPIASAMGLLNVIQLENDHSRLPQYLELIGSSLEKQDTFIKAMLSFSKSTRVKNKAEGVDIKQLIEQCLQDLQHLPGCKEISIKLDVIPTKEPFYSDKMKLYIILANVISNSIKYRNPHIKNIISIKAEPTEAGIMLLVEDNGIGISSEIQPAIFEMFYRGTELSDGSGLGLYIVKQTVEKLRGTISVTSKPGVGSCFTIIIPNQQELQGPKSIKIKSVQPHKKNKP